MGSFSNVVDGHKAEIEHFTFGGTQFSTICLHKPDAINGADNIGFYGFIDGV
jgi:hypothetical protein